MSANVTKEMTRIEAIPLITGVPLPTYDGSPGKLGILTV